MRFWLLTAAILLGACNPADQKAKSVKDRLEAGELVEFTKPGYRRPACSERAPDWSDIRDFDESGRERIVVGAQKSILNPGAYSCFRIGSAINLHTSSKRQDQGRARIVKLAIRKLEKLEAKDMGGGFYAQNNNFYALKDAVRAKLSDRDEGYVTIVYLEYLPNSATDEKDIREKVAREGDSDGLVETHNDGDTVSECRTKWKDLEAEEKFHSDLLSGKLKSIYRNGDLNCLPQGAVVDLKVNRNGASSGQLRILKIKKFRISHIDASYFSQPEDFETLKKSIRGEWVSVMHVAPVTPVQENCAYKPNPISIVFPAASEDILRQPVWTANLKGRTCYAKNELVTVNIIFADRMSSLQFSAIVKSQTYEGEGSVIELENLGVIK